MLDRLAVTPAQFRRVAYVTLGSLTLINCTVASNSVTAGNGGNGGNGGTGAFNAGIGGNGDISSRPGAIDPVSLDHHDPVLVRLFGYAIKYSG